MTYVVYYQEIKHLYEECVLHFYLTFLSFETYD
jgi:hypothetical protein